MKKGLKITMQNTLPGVDVQQAQVKNPNQSMPCLLYTSPSPRDRTRSRMPSSA